MCAPQLLDSPDRAPVSRQLAAQSDGESFALGTAANLANGMEMIIIPRPERFTSSGLQGY